MTRIIRRLLVVVGLASVATWASVDVAQGRSAVTDGDCFACSTDTFWTGCSSGKHKDFNGGVLHPNDFSGTQHSGCQDSDCDHTAYNLPLEGDDLHLASEALKDGSDDALLKALDGKGSVRLNQERSALQVVDANGAVVLHSPIEKSQTERLAQALASNQTR
jgi:hypothetical protein